MNCAYCDAELKATYIAKPINAVVFVCPMVQLVEHPQIIYGPVGALGTIEAVSRGTASQGPNP